ncbi:MAG TPA: hypothetical protein VGI60_09815 [Chthoniobacterales bacterium]
MTLQGCGKPKAMDALWATTDPVDDNGLAKSPVWSAMQQNGQPPDPCQTCPCGTEDPGAWQSAANCTDQSLQNNSSLECFGHWNWFPVEYEGIVTWGGHSNSFWDDDDYYMEVKRSDRSLEVTGSDKNGLHIEFDSEETVDNWDDTGTWWDDFHHNYVDQDNAASRINGKFVIVVGLLGLDSQHSKPSELNPTYAMFVHVQDDPANDQWAFFVKNWGNEGYCGDNEEYLDTLRHNTLMIRIPHSGATNVTLAQNVYVYGDDEDERNKQSWTYQPVSDGALLTFNLRDPGKQVGFVGDLTFSWTGNTTPVITEYAKSQASAQPPPRSFLEDNDGNVKLKASIQRLSPADQQILFQEVQKLRQYPRSAAKQGRLSTSPVTKPSAPSGRFPNYGAMVRAGKDEKRLVEHDQARELINSCLKAHGVE